MSQTHSARVMFASRTSDTPCPRPRPPAKMRRRSSLAALKKTSSALSERRTDPITASPPPAYATTTSDELVVPSDSHSFPDTLLGSPVPSSFRFKPLESPGQEWMDEKSKGELAELLHKAEDIIKERGNELGLTTSVVKTLYENNIALKTKHEAFLARLPISSPTRPPPESSPEDSCLVISRNNSYSSSISLQDTHGSPPAPAPPPFYRRHARRVSMSASEISLLADQNAELMHKLEELELESNSADQAGRRSLQRLEREISSLREALEKTQAKSQELEEKTKGLDKGIDRVVEDAWKRKRDREMRIQNLKSVGRDESRVKNFAPRGSMIGHYAFSRSMNNLADFDDDDQDEDETLTNDNAIFAQPEHEIIQKLLHKVHELEETNSRILQQQQETSSQLQSVQRDTEQMAKVYDFLGDPQDVEIEIEDPEFDIREILMNSLSHGPPLRKRDSQTSSGPGSTRSGKHKTRKTLADLFEDPSGQHPDNLSPYSLNQLSSWDDNRHRSSYSLDSTGLASPALSTLSFLNSPQQQNLEDLSPAIGRTLDAELGSHFKGESWGLQREGFHLRTHSLSNLSQWSVPSSPSPSSNSSLPHLNKSVPSSSNASNIIPQIMEPFPLPTPPISSLRLSVDPPTPEPKRSIRPSNSRTSLLSQDSSQSRSLPPGSRSPRQQFISQRIKDRRNRWEDERFGSLSSISSAWEPLPSAGGRLEPVFVPPPHGRRPQAYNEAGPARITSIIDSLVDRFDDVTAGDGGLAGRIRFQREDTPDTESGYEESDEGGISEGLEDSSFETTTEYEEDDDEGETEGDESSLRTPQISEDNALQLRSMKSPASRPHREPSGLRASRASSGGQPSASGKMAKNNGGGGGNGKWGNVLLELWLWLQFAVIMFVFLCAMAKRGPKAVLADAEGRTARTRKISVHAKRH